MKSVVKYILIAGVAITALVFVVFYQQYMGEDTDPSTEKNTGSLLNKRLNAIITDTFLTAIRQRPSSPARRYSLHIGYTDIDTKEVSGFSLNYRSQDSLAVGDTLTKEKGERLMLVYKKGSIKSVPVE